MELPVPIVLAIVTAILLGWVVVIVRGRWL